jgi:hypothetical protein
MSTQTTRAAIAIHRLGVGDKREQLRGLSDLMWDIEDQLAQINAARARLMASIQEDLRRQAA